GSLALVRDPLAGKLSLRPLRCVFPGFPTYAPPWQFYHLGSRRVLSSQDVTFDDSIYFYHLHPHRTSPVPLPPLSLVPDPPPAQLRGVTRTLPTLWPLAAQRAWRPLCRFPPRPSSLPLQRVAVDFGAARGGDTGGADSGGAGSGGAECPTGTGGAGGAAVGGNAIGGTEGAGAGGTGVGGTGGPGAGDASAGGTGAPGGAGATGACGAGGTGAGDASAGGTGACRQETLSPERLR
ncbi:unnamed protein product, partial [Closterium sp. NIES-54]